MFNFTSYQFLHLGCLRRVYLLSVSPLVYVAMIVIACIQAGNLLVSKIVRQNLLFLVYARIQADNLPVPKIVRQNLFILIYTGIQADNFLVPKIVRQNLFILVFY